MPWNQCFVCTGEIQNPISGVDENSILLCQILEIPHLRAGKSKEFQEISYCHDCVHRILSIRDMLEELEGLEKKVLDEKYLIEMQLKESSKNYSMNSGTTSNDQFKLQIVTELRSTSMESMLMKIRKKRVGRKLCRPRDVQTMESVTIPRISSNSVPYSAEVEGNGNKMEDSIFVPHHEAIFLTGTSESFVGENSCLGNQSVPSGDDFEEVLMPSVPEGPWTSEIEECDIKLEAVDVGQMDECDDPFHITATELDIAQHDNINDPAQTTTTTPEGVLTTQEINDEVEEGKCPQIEYKIEDPSNINAFVCGTCHTSFDQYEELEVHLRLHKRHGGRKSTSTRPRKNPGEPKIPRDPIKAVPSGTRKKCEECGKILSTHRTWKEHVSSIHRGQFKFKCTKCSYGCQFPKDMRKHSMRMHSGDKVFPCHSCYKSFKHENALNRHISRAHMVALT